MAETETAANIKKLFDLHGNKEVEQARRVFVPAFETLSTSLGLDVGATLPW
jgi:hypothetical protein